MEAGKTEQVAEKKLFFDRAYFITGTAYAGKSTMVRLLAQKHGGILCEENYHDRLLPELDRIWMWEKDVELVSARASLTPEGEMLIQAVVEVTVET